MYSKEALLLRIGPSSDLLRSIPLIMCAYARVALNPNRTGRVTLSANTRVPATLPVRLLPILIAKRPAVTVDLPIIEANTLATIVNPPQEKGKQPRREQASPQ